MSLLFNTQSYLCTAPHFSAFSQKEGLLPSLLLILLTWSHFLSRNSRDSLLLTKSGAHSFAWCTRSVRGGPTQSPPRPLSTRSVDPTIHTLTCLGPGLTTPFMPPCLGSAVLSIGSHFASSPAHRVYLTLQATVRRHLHHEAFSTHLTPAKC